MEGMGKYSEQVQNMSVKEMTEMLKAAGITPVTVTAPAAAAAKQAPVAAAKQAPVAAAKQAPVAAAVVEQEFVDEEDGSDASCVGIVELKADLSAAQKGRDAALKKLAAAEKTIADAEKNRIAVMEKELAAAKNKLSLYNNGAIVVLGCVVPAACAAAAWFVAKR